jgi:hypothetical protein
MKVSMENDNNFGYEKGEIMDFLVHKVRKPEVLKR